jgi:hypothetical protein
MTTFVPLYDSNGNLITQNNLQTLDFVQENLFFNPEITLNMPAAPTIVFQSSNYDNFNQGVYNILLDNGASKVIPDQTNLNASMTESDFLAESVVDERVIRIGNFYYFHVSGDDFSVENSNGVYTPIFFSDPEIGGTAVPLNGNFSSVKEIYDNNGRVVSTFTESNTFKVFELKKKCQEIFNASTNVYGYRFVFLRTFVTISTQTYSSGQIDLPGITTEDHAIIPLKFFTNVGYMWDKNGSKYFLVDPAAFEPTESFANGAYAFLLLRQDDNTYKPLQSNILLPRSTLINNIDRLAIGISTSLFSTTANLAESGNTMLNELGTIATMSVGFPEITRTFISEEGWGATIYWKKGNNSAYTRVQIASDAGFTTILQNKVTLNKKLSFSLNPNTTYHVRLIPLNLPTDTVVNNRAITSSFTTNNNSLSSVFTNFDKRVTTVVPGNVSLTSELTYYYDILNKSYWVKFPSSGGFLFRLVINDGQKNYILRSDEIYTKTQLVSNTSQLKIKNRGESETDYYLPINASGLDTTRFILLIN